jgi:hypothetical protein
MVGSSRALLYFIQTPLLEVTIIFMIGNLVAEGVVVVVSYLNLRGMICLRYGMLSCLLVYLEVSSTVHEM